MAVVLRLYWGIVNYMNNIENNPPWCHRGAFSSPILRLSPKYPFELQGSVGHQARLNLRRRCLVVEVGTMLRQVILLLRFSNRAALCSGESSDQRQGRPRP